MLQPRIELGPKRWQRSILPLNYCSLTAYLAIKDHNYEKLHPINLQYNIFFQ